MAYRNLHQMLRIPTLAETLAERSQVLLKERQQKQKELFWSKRLERSSFDGIKEKEEPKVKPNPRLEMLKKWKKEKMKRLEEEKKKKKPAFKAGILQRKANGSPLLNNPIISGKKLLDSKDQKVNFKNKCKHGEGVVTRSMTRKKEHFVAPNTASIKENQIKLIRTLKNSQQSNVLKIPDCVAKLPNPIKLTFPYSPQMRKKNFKIPSNHSNFNTDKSSNTKVFKFEAIATDVGKGKNSNEKPKAALKKDKCVQNDEAEKKFRKVDLDDWEEEEFKSKIYSFRNYIKDETKKLLEACSRWKNIQQELDEFPKDVNGEIDCLIGKTNLLTSDKFKQFSDLIDKCEKGDSLIKVDDLQGFQDWVSIEVNKLNSEFEKLENQKCNNWKADPCEEKPEAVKKVKVNTKVKRPQGKSNIRAHILAARKLLKEEKGFDFKVKSPSSVNKENVHIHLDTPKKTLNIFENNSSSSPRMAFRDLNNITPKMTRSKSKGIVTSTDSSFVSYLPAW